MACAVIEAVITHTAAVTTTAVHCSQFGWGFHKCSH